VPGFKDHFSKVSAGYAAHRPDYPSALLDFLTEIAPAHGLALDCGCGSGQLSALLAARFDSVVATDASAAQIAAATPHPRVDYRVAPAERSGLADGSADLIAAAQAAHWFDLGAFYAEVRRVARPGAALALISYGLPDMDDEPGMIIDDFYGRALDPYWPPERRHIEDSYSSLAFPFVEIAAPSLAIERDWALGEVVGYLDTWSAVRALEKVAGRAPFDAMAAELALAWGDPETPRRIVWPIAIRAGRI